METVLIEDLPVAVGISTRLNKYHNVLWNNSYKAEFEKMCKTTNLRCNIKDATEEIASMCDHAATVDGTGFSKHDVKTGFLMIKMIPFADVQRLRAWCRTLYKYRGQLGCDDEGFYQRIFEA